MPAQKLRLVTPGPYHVVVDLGVNGGVVYGWSIDDFQYCKPPATPADWVKFLKHLKTDEQLTLTFEKVSAFKSKFAMKGLFGQQGLLEGIAAALQVRINRLNPATWQRHYNLLSRRDSTGVKESATVKKNRHKHRAQELFPTTDVCHWNADALLMYHYIHTSRF
jgi:hypothetical protein